MDIKAFLRHVSVVLFWKCALYCGVRTSCHLQPRSRYGSALRLRSSESSAMTRDRDRDRVRDSECEARPFSQQPAHARSQQTQHPGGETRRAREA